MRRRGQSDRDRLIEKENPEKLLAFRDEITSGKQTAFWSDRNELKLRIYDALSEISRREDLTGWVRGNQSVDPALANEFARVSKENAELREKGGNAEYCGLSYDDLAAQLRKDNLDALLLLVRELLTTHPNENLGWIAEAAKGRRARTQPEVVRECMRLIHIGLLELETVSRSSGPKEFVRLSGDCKRFLNRFDLRLETDAALPERQIPPSKQV